jgi:hypothetical protein
VENCEFQRQFCCICYNFDGLNRTAADLGGSSRNFLSQVQGSGAALDLRQLELELESMNPEPGTGPQVHIELPCWPLTSMACTG